MIKCLVRHFPKKWIIGATMSIQNIIITNRAVPNLLSWGAFGRADDAGSHGPTAVLCAAQHGGSSYSWHLQAFLMQGEHYKNCKLKHS